VADASASTAAPAARSSRPARSGHAAGRPSNVIPCSTTFATLSPPNDCSQPPSPEISSEQFYETDESRGFARGFSIQTISPLPIGWAEHVLADGHWGAALREYMRDYNHWTVLGVLCELQPQADNRVTLAGEQDQYGMPIAKFTHSLCENDKRNIAFVTNVTQEIWRGADAQDTLKIDRYAHLVGGCRMGFAPAESVCDAGNKVWGLENLFVADGSCFPTQGAANPALMIMAVAARLADLLERKRTGGSEDAPRRGLVKAIAR
jgi:hypothetical protein